MTRLVPLMVIAALIHATVWVTGIFLTNLDATPYYGGSSGFLPSTGDSDHAYDKFSAWLSGGGQMEDVADPGDGPIALLRWAISAPICGAADLVKALIAISIIKYDLIDLLPTDGFGNWLRIIIHAIGVLITLTFFTRVVEFAVRAGVFSNVYMMGVLGLVGALGISATLLDFGGLCG